MRIPEQNPAEVKGTQNFALLRDRHLLAMKSKLRNTMSQERGYTGVEEVETCPSEREYPVAPLGAIIPGDRDAVEKDGLLHHKGECIIRTDARWQHQVDAGVE